MKKQRKAKLADTGLGADTRMHTSWKCAPGGLCEMLSFAARLSVRTFVPVAVKIKAKLGEFKLIIWTIPNHIGLFGFVESVIINWKRVPNYFLKSLICEKFLLLEKCMSLSSDFAGGGVVCQHLYAWQDVLRWD